MKKRKNQSISQRVFNVFNYTFFILMGITTIFPFLNLIAKSFSSEKALISGKVTIFPVEFQTGTYKFVLGNPQFLNAFKISILVTLIGTVLGVLMTITIAYPLSKPHLKGRRWILLYYVFAMIFNGGLIPTYLVMQKLNLVNNFWVLILPVLVNVYNMLIMKNYFESLPDSLEESARIDGASTFEILFKIILPLSKPVLATIGLFFAVAHWNSYYNAMIYITKVDLKPLQLYLKELVSSTKDVLDQAGYEPDINGMFNSSPEAVQAASIVAATVPIIVVYPFLQKYFVKGVLIGSVKG
ncbi:carbohydrate ABC transporter permease [Vagococcus lutrae]|uniref:Carbohydrate ABC transporter permease n=1 Tax=Vagococcus lutrae TaxID=81947 RepID=A0AAE9XEK4_9ENTE|nr:carbohydrate ABC transporter permease [Vagococcus lutrae]MDT2805677.1 carbohydrate ABC transporter permease [Vagococcus lutrae]MDY3705435.1 carbohydrate ABC transporter permease [Vagococcus lutrae]QZN88768.1 carbohydrate ABC transporter permease [Vagococcus lutrae]RST92638.1 sugar ABC transporter permease [Vagococcus lutrae]UQF18939.1 carbohydrate ABC transporter permease [Vagococcus lutrae]